MRTTHLIPYVVDVGAHPIAVAEAFARDQLVTAQQRFGLAQLHHHVAVLGPLHDAVHDLADAVLELVVLLFALVLAHTLHDHLLGCLCRDAAKIDRRQRIDQVAAQLNVRLKLARDMQRDLGLFILHHLDRLRPARQAHVAGLFVDGGANVLLGAVFGAAGFLDGLLHRLQHFVPLDRLFACDSVGNQQQLRAGDGGFHVLVL